MFSHDMAQNIIFSEIDKQTQQQSWDDNTGNPIKVGTGHLGITESAFN